MEIFILTLSEPTGKLDDYYTLLSAEEKYMADRKSSPQARERFILSKAIARILLAQKLKQAPEKIVITYGKNGKPYVEGNPLFYNVSHSGVLMAIAIGEREMGIDLEYMKNRDFKELSKHSFEGPVLDGILDSPDIRVEFYKQWTLFEAIIKLKGLTVFQAAKSLPAYRHFEKIEDDYMLAIAADYDFTPSLKIVQKSL